jgi:hypothetical protein
MNFRLIDYETRKRVRCCICGTDVSVKYELKSFNDNVKEENRRYYCNKCITLNLDNNYSYKYARANMLATSYGLTTGNVYIILKHKHLYGTVSVYDTDGMYLCECRTDCFDKYADLIN